jgi:hypothetical protein
MGLKPVEVVLDSLNTGSFFVQVGDDEDLGFEEV